MTPVRLEPAALRSRVKHSTTEPLRSLGMGCYVRGDKNGMGCYVQGDKNSVGCFVRDGKSLWDVLSGV